MAAPVPQEPTASRTLLNYYLTPDRGGVTRVYPGTAGDKLREYDTQPAIIHDLRVSKEHFTVDRNGFQLVQHKSREEAFDDESRVTSDVYPETSHLLQKVTGATYVVPFSHIIRRDSWDDGVEAAKKANPEDIVHKLNPAMFCHVDQSYNGAVQVLNDNVPAGYAARLAKTRWGIINVWRPIERTVLREPIAVCDWNSIKESDLYPITAHLPRKGAGTFDNVSKGVGFEIWNIASSPEHRWYYAPKMTTNEVLLIKCFDSRKDLARLSPHTAFQSEVDSGPARQSIEVRCLVFWEDQSVE